MPLLRGTSRDAIQPDRRRRHRRRRENRSTNDDPTHTAKLPAGDGGSRRLKHGVFCSVVDLQAAINRFIAEHNQSPRPFVWRADPDAIIAARNRGFQTLESIH